jgi:hypothetical protein
MTRIRILLFCLFVVACTKDRESLDTLEAAGYSDVQLTGYNFFACSKEDEFHTGFVAYNPRGNPVTGTVCCGLYKGCSIEH